MKEQPGVSDGQQTYCPVSGVVFVRGETSALRDAGSAELVFCCESCARHFDENAEAVKRTRRIQ